MHSACPLCDAPIDRAALHIDFPDLPVLKCGECAFIFPAHTLAPDAIDAYYREDFASDWHRKGQRINAMVNAAALAKLIDLRDIRSFLDVGTGYGCLLQRLSASHRIECTGVEPSEQEARWGNANLGVRIINAWLGKAELPGQSFDAVGCFEVIEHAPNPRAMVAEMARFVRPGGWLLVGTDNFESAAVRRLGPRFPKWIPHSHISDFGPQTLRRCIESVPGLRVERTLSYTPWEIALRSVMSRFQKPSEPEACYSLAAERGREMQRTYKHWWLRSTMTRAWFALGNRRNPDGSIMYLAARKAS